MLNLFGEEGCEDLMRGAEISDCGRYRYSLARSWQRGSGVCCFVMLNPSTADGTQDDPTIRRCIGFARSWGFRGLVVRNLFALRATDPAQLLLAPDPVSPLGDSALAAARDADRIVVAWGATVPFQRDRQALLALDGLPLYCLGTTKNGQPRHPLYVPAGQELLVFRSGRVRA